MSSRKRDVGFTHKFKIDKKGKIDNVKPQKFTFSAKEEDFTQVEMIYIHTSAACDKFHACTMSGIDALIL